MKTRISIITILAAGGLAFANAAMADDVDFNKPHKASDHPNPNVCCNYSHRYDEMTSSVVPRSGPRFEPEFEYDDIFGAGDEPDDDAPLSPHEAAAAAAKKDSDAAWAQARAALAAARAKEAAADVAKNAAAAAATAENAAAREPSETSRNDARRTDKSQQAARAAMAGARVAQMQRRASQPHVPRHNAPQRHRTVLRIEVRR